MKLRNTKGFTLIELMIVVVIIGILAAIAIPKFGNASARAKEKEADGILKQVYTLQQTYYAQWGTFAGSVANLQSVGFETPTNLQNYTWADAVATTSATCMAKTPATSSHNSRSVNFTTGAISNC